MICIGKSHLFINLVINHLLWTVDPFIVTFLQILHAFFHVVSHWIRDIILIFTLNFAEINGFFKFPIDPVATTDCLIVDIVCTKPSNLTCFEFSNILTPVLEKQMTHPVLLQILNISIINLSIRILNFAFFC